MNTLEDQDSQMRDKIGGLLDKPELLQRGRGQHSQSAFVLRRHTAINPGVTISGAISYDTMSSPVILHTSLTAQRYVDTILQPVIVSFMERHQGASFHQVYALILVKTDGVAIYHVEVGPVSGSGNSPFFPSRRTQRQQQIKHNKKVLN
ncbi:transposable element Tc1 transposase [Trichonephila clavipes]|nr:transposable element Tc1 transposase [Trichonephila clavipes]